MKTKLIFAVAFIGLLALADAAEVRAQGTGGVLGLSTSTNQSVYRVGDRLTVSVSINNPGIATNVDLYFGMLLPDGRIQTFTDLSFDSVTCSFASIASCRPIAANVPLAAPFSFEQPAFFTHDWTSGDAGGDYLLIAAALVPGALTDNSVDPGDVVVLATRSFRFDSSVALSLTGHWSGPFSSSVGESGSVTADLVQSGNTLTGTWVSESNLGSGEGTLSGSVTGTTVSYTLTETTPDCEGSFTGSGTISGSPANTITFSHSGVDCEGSHSVQGTLTRQNQ